MAQRLVHLKMQWSLASDRLTVHWQTHNDRWSLSFEQITPVDDQLGLFY